MKSAAEEGGSGGIAEILGCVRRKGIQLWSQDGELRYKAPKGALTAEDARQLWSFREQLVALLSNDTVRQPSLEPRSRSQRVPLTFSQLAHWRLNRLAEQTTKRSMAAATRLRGTLHVSLLRESLMEIVRRHEALRTRIIAIDGIPEQRIESCVSCDLQVDDLRRLPEPSRHDAILSIIHQTLMEPIHVATDALFTVRLVELGDSEHVLIVALEHSVSDAVSVNILLRDLFSWYARTAIGLVPELPPLPIQFPDYACWQAAAHASWLHRHAPYWRERLSNCGRLRFPSTLHTRADAADGWGSIPLRVNSELKSRLQEWCRRQQTTVVIAVFTACAGLVMRWCGASDVVLRFQTDGRFDTRLTNPIGFFASMLHLRVTLADEDTFLDLLRRVTHEYCQAYEHHDFSYLAAQPSPGEFTANTCFNWVSQGPRSNPFQLHGLPDVLSAEPVSFVNPLLRSYDEDAEPVILFHESEQEIVGAVHFPLARLSVDRMEPFARTFAAFIEYLMSDCCRRVREACLR